MSEKGIINSALHRPLEAGSYYDKFIPSSTCESTYLGKGDTFFSMDGIKANILKNYSQCKKLAPQLQKKSLQATVTAIYDFLYNHIQYRADGADQNLRSPACSWSVRKTGIDCKSYSIFAGCILSSLGIKYYIRKIKQPYMLPSEFTHVFITVPKDQKSGSLNGGYFVIDATKHQNTEAAFSEKNDVFMSKLEHFGLQAAGPQGATMATVKGNFAPVTPTAKEGFKEFLLFLQETGIDWRIICKIRNTVNKLIAKGIDPEFVITTEGIVIEGELIKYAYPEKHGRKMYRSPIAVAMRRADQLNGLNAGGSGSGSGTGTGAGDETATEGELGEELGTIALDMFESSGWWDRTFGAIFANGFMISCFGSSNNPKKSAGEVALDASEYLKASGLTEESTGGLNTKNLQAFVDVASAYIAERKFGSTNGDIVKCTRDANKVGYEGMKIALSRVLSLADQLLKENNGKLTVGAERFLTSYHYKTPSGYANGKLLDDTRFKTPSPVVTVVAPKLVVIPGGSANTGGGSGSGSGGGTGGGGTITLPGSGTTPPPTTKPPTTGGNTPAPPKPTIPWQTGGGGTPKTQQMGMNNILVIGLIAGGIYMAYKNKSKTK
ncbi:MAG: hypothetical protein Q8O62_09940 [Aequorivita sp.]|nr:hypothetical protein [Aequorivita sp.]